MDEIETEIDEHIKKNEYVEDLESGNYTYGEKINYVAISPNGSIVAKFNPYDSSILVTKVTTNANKNIPFDKKKFFNKKPSNVFGWSLAISDIIDEGNDIGEGMIKIFKFSFNDNNNDKEDDNYSIYHLGGAVTFLNNSNKNSTTLICMNCVEIQKINIILDKNIIISKEEFIEKDKKLFIIEEDRESNVKFHIWIISGCLNDYFSISKDDIGLSDSNISILSKYDEHHNAFTKANGKVVFKIDGEQFRTVHEITIQRTIFGENDAVTDEYEYQSCNLEPWNNYDNTKTISGRFLNNDKRLLLIIGQNSIQLWKSKSINFVDFNNFKKF
uniref:Uncharacterized protein n=1 Tax=Rhizophagus irregularis (strain DAOM 181602 / DAOM 197198 / MUCL 43194) TaxID=747089 RepID=U9TKN7_RHIID